MNVSCNACNSPHPSSSASPPAHCGLIYFLMFRGDVADEQTISIRRDHCMRTEHGHCGTSWYPDTGAVATNQPSLSSYFTYLHILVTMVSFLKAKHNMHVPSLIHHSAIVVCCMTQTAHPCSALLFPSLSYRVSARSSTSTFRRISIRSWCREAASRRRMISSPSA